MEFCTNKPQIVLYEFYCVGNLNFVSHNEYAFNNIINNSVVPCYKLEYYRELDGLNDVIRYSRFDKEDNIVSYYTIRNNIAVTGKMKDNHIEWNYNVGMTNFVLARFIPFMNKGISFANKNLNDIVENEKSLCRMRTKNR